MLTRTAAAVLGLVAGTTLVAIPTPPAYADGCSATFTAGSCSFGVTAPGSSGGGGGGDKTSPQRQGGGTSTSTSGGGSRGESSSSGGAPTYPSWALEDPSVRAGSATPGQAMQALCDMARGSAAAGTVGAAVPAECQAGQAAPAGPGAPPPPPPPPDPAVLARTAVAQMNLRAIGIGIVPEARPGSRGVIGMPTWMWVADPGEQTIGPITRTASERGFTVTATATMDRIVWTMGDGRTVTCHGAGTPYQDAFGKRSSPTCGHTYTRKGRYTVSAVSYWTVHWEGIGQSGDISLQFTRTAQVEMGEVQVIITR